MSEHWNELREVIAEEWLLKDAGAATATLNGSRFEIGT
jgi:hypothetical protein